ncbi:hypothetical protein [Ramlibacter albus]|uniref:Sel1 repeat family protein n=1 Tax=Ramlibacter albus TaxID=2079448 RepID=A0A923MCN0_9BURK|nr:hypothetical protein [Ramlibacter albus]MBC5767530.1 hypothetical protein [Ramlibacter albus]
MNSNRSAFTCLTAADLADIAASLCSSMFRAHLDTWRDALQGRAEGAEGVPESYLMAMRKVISAEAADRSIDFEDAIAAVIAIHALGTTAARDTAAHLLQDLQLLGSETATVLAAALMVHEPDAGAAARVQGISLLRALRLNSPRVDVRAHATLLLADAYRCGFGIEKDVQVALHLYSVALEEGGCGTGRAHFHLGTWLLRTPTEGERSHGPRIAKAEKHFRDGTDAGCMRCVAALGLLHAKGRANHPDVELGRELLELAANVGLVPVIDQYADAAPAVPAAITFHRGKWHRRARGKSLNFVQGLRNLLRSSFQMA